MSALRGPILGKQKVFSILEYICLNLRKPILGKICMLTKLCMIEETITFMPKS